MRRRIVVSLVIVGMGCILNAALLRAQEAYAKITFPQNQAYLSGLIEVRGAAVATGTFGKGTLEIVSAL